MVENRSGGPNECAYVQVNWSNVARLRIAGYRVFQGVWHLTGMYETRLFSPREGESTFNWQAVRYYTRFIFRHRGLHTPKDVYTSVILS